jgi:hypothetical protein
MYHILSHLSKMGDFLLGVKKTITGGVGNLTDYYRQNEIVA